MKTAKRTTLGLLAAAVLGTGSIAIGPAPASAGELDVQTPAPPGTNDWSCKPSSTHPNPVVLVNGTFETMAKNWTVLAPQIKARGYCVYAFNYGNSATAHIPTSAQELKVFVDRVLAATKARKVDLVGHSQGGMMPRHYMRFLGGSTKVGELIGIAPSNHGTTSPLAPPPGWIGLCDACTDQVAGSPFLTALNAGGDTDAGVDYTVLMTKYDEVVTPYTSQALSGPAKRVTNVVLQNACPTDLFEHDQAPNDPVVAQWVLNALARKGPANPAFRPTCV